ncbi:hypothetical protein T190115A13A_190005 [Tenacibaculum sp. 190524A02b]|uniref:Uncharacterized protein n=1 Tax=Tenacibaculum vairaonense TaxID=3137860 RepID=A0ABM9PJE9_9FLAO
MKTTILHNHYRLLAIVEAYASVYSDDIQNVVLQKEIIDTLSDAREIQKQGSVPLFVFPN